MLGRGALLRYFAALFTNKTVMAHAATKGHLEVVCELVRAGAALDLRDKDQRTALWLLVGGGASDGRRTRRCGYGLRLRLGRWRRGFG